MISYSIQYPISFTFDQSKVLPSASSNVYFTYMLSSIQNTFSNSLGLLQLGYYMQYIKDGIYYYQMEMAVTPTISGNSVGLPQYQIVVGFNPNNQQTLIFEFKQLYNGFVPVNNASILNINNFTSYINNQLGTIFKINMSSIDPSSINMGVESRNIQNTGISVYRITTQYPLSVTTTILSNGTGSKAILTLVGFERNDLYGPLYQYVG